MFKKLAKKQPEILRYEELEQRVLFSADFVPGLDADTDAVYEQVLVEDVAGEAQTDTTAASDPAVQTEETRHELVFVNEDVTDYQQLIDDIQESDENRILEVVVLDSDRDGIEQVSEILADRSDLDAVHFITHGSDGQISLGSSLLNSESLENNNADIQNWGYALSEDADLLIYGCNLTATAEGEQLVDSLAQLTGADVAASDDITGHEDLGGDWQLEYTEGSIETDVALTSEAQSSWSSTLEAPTAADATVSTNEDTDYVFVATDFNFSDAESDPLVSVEITTLESAGALQLSGVDVTLDQVISKADIDAGNLKFVPAANANGTGYDSFGFSVNDGTDDSVASYTMTVDVTAVNDAPSGADATVITNEDTDYVFVATDFGFSDALDVDAFLSVKITTLPLAGTLNHADSGAVGIGDFISKADIDLGKLTFIPAADANGNGYASFTFQVRDDGGTANGGVDLDQSANTLTIDVTAVNDAPVIDLDADNSTASGLDYQTNFTDGDLPVNIIDSDALLTDVDSANLDSITVTIANVKKSGKELLAASAGSTGLIVSFDPAPTTTTAVLTISGPGTVEDFKSVLDTVTYDNEQNNPDTTTREITFFADDGTDTSVVATTYVSVFLVSGGNNPPVATEHTVSTVEDNDLNFSSADFTFFDVDGDPLTSATITNQSLAGGTLTYGGITVNNNDVLTAAELNTLVYTPAGDANGTSLATFDFAVNDVDTGVVFAQMTIDVTAVNDAPTATNLSAAETYTEDTALNLTDIVVSDIDSANVTVTLTLSDVAAGSLNIATSGTVTSSFAGGVWTASGAIANVNTLLADVTFTPSLNYNSNFNIATSVNDGVAAAITGSKVMTGTAVNDVSVITGTVAGAVTEGNIGDAAVTATGSIAISDVDDADSPSFADVASTVGDNSYGAFVLSSGTWTYTLDQSAVQDLDASDSVTDTITFTATDGSTQLITVTITGTDDVSVITGTVAGAVTEGNIGDAAVTATGSIAISDVDADDSPSFADVASTVGDNSYGAFVLSSGTWTYTLDQSAVQDLDASDSVTDTITFTATDGSTQLITVTITGTDDVSVITGTVAGAVTEGNIGDAAVTATGSIAISDVDADDSPSFADVASTVGDNSYGAFVLSSGTWTYTLDQSTVQDLDASDSVTDTITFTATDGSTQLITVTITGTDDVSVITGTVAGAVTEGNIGDAAVTATGSIAISDVDDADSPSFADVASTVGDNSYGAFVLSSGTWTYTLDQSTVQDLDASDSVTDTITFTATDGSTQLITVTITGTDDVSVITGTVAGAVTEGNIGDAAVTATGSIAISDVDAADSPSFADVASTVGDNSYGAFVLSSGTWTYTLDQSTVQDLDASDSVTDTITFTATDGSTQLITVTITGTDDVSVITGTVAGAVTEGNIGDAAVTATGSIAISDVDAADSPSFADVASTVGDNSYGAFVLSSGTWTYTLDQSTVQDLDASDSVTDTITFTATDGSTQLITVTITGTDDVSVITGTVAGAVTEGNIGDAAVTATGSIAISDVDADDSPSFADVASTVGDNSYGAFVLSSGTWTYTLDQSTVQDLDASDSVTDTITFTATDGSTQLITVTITGTEDTPTLRGLDINGDLTVDDAGTTTAIALNPTYREGLVAQTLFSGSIISTVEGGQTIEQLVFTVTNVTDGADEIIYIDNTAVELTNGNIVTSGSDTYRVTLTGTTATVTLDIIGTSITDAQTLVDGLSYENTQTNPTKATRVVTLTSLQDSGSGDSTVLNISSTVAVRGINPLDNTTDLRLILSTEKDVTGTGAAPSLESWSAGDALNFGGVDLDLEDITVGDTTTDGDLSLMFSLENFTDDGNAEIYGIHYVTSTITVAGENLQAGDLLFTSRDQETLTSSDATTLAVDNPDIVLFRPDTAGDYGAGMFIMLKENVLGGVNIHAFTLVETDTIIGVGAGATTVTAGNFLISHSGPSDHDNIYVYDTDLGTKQLLINGNDIGIDGEKIQGLELIEGKTVIGGITLNPGNILVTLGSDQNNVGGTNLDTLKSDIFYLDISATTEAAGTTVADAILLMEGAEPNIGLAGEEINAIGLSVSSTALRFTDLDGAPNFTEDGAAVVLDADVSISDYDLDALNGGAGNYSNTSLTLVRNGGSSSEDVFTFNDGNGITLDSGNLIKNAQIIASFDTTAGELVITFTDANGEIPTSADTNNILRQITYTNSSDAPPASAQIDWSFSDGTDTAIGSTTVSITAVNDAPVVAAPAGALSATEQTNLSIEGTGFSVADGDEADSGAVATLSVGEGSLTVVVGDSGVTINSGDGTGTVQLSGTIAQLDNLLTGSSTGTITYFNSSDTPSASTTITVEVNDLGNIGTDPGLTGDGSSEQGSNNQTINITGVNDAPVITIVDVAGTITEGGTVTETGSITFTDLDLTDTPTATEATASVTTALTLTVAQQSAIEDAFTISPAAGNDNNGTINWDYTITEGELNFLANGETVTVIFTITVDDANGGTDTQDVTITITGTNDAPVITDGPDTAGLSETDAGLSTSGDLTVGDVDTTDVVTASIDSLAISGTSDRSDAAAPNDAALLAMFSINPAAILDGTENSDTLNWSFDSGAEAFDYLATDETLILEYTVKATDDDGTPASDTETVTITITGTNDAPVITDGPDTAGLSETDAGLSTSGDLTVGDVDTTDVVTASVDSLAISGTSDRSDAAAPSDAALLAMLTVNPAAILDGTENSDTLNWTFDSGAEAFDYLAAGESLVLTYTIEVTDSSGATDTQTVVITITGTNDAPTISDVANIVFVEAIDASAQDLIGSGTVDFDDLDGNDLVDISVALTTPASWSGGSLDAGLKTQLESGFSASVINSPAPGSITWDYAANDLNLDFLAVGETITLTFTLTATDNSAATATDTVTITIVGADETPTITATGDATVRSGEPYTLNLNASQAVDGWIINWGDGNIETINSNPSSVDHIYTNVGMTYNITVSATDAGGTYMENELLIASADSDAIYRFEEISGVYLQQMGVGDDLNYAADVTVGPDGLIYVSGYYSDNVLRYNLTTGAFVDEFVTNGAGGLDGALGMAFGADGHLYVASSETTQILRYDGTSGAFIDVFVSAGSSGLITPEHLLFGADGNLYVSDYDADTVLLFNGSTGAFIDTFVTAASGGLDSPEQMAFGPDGHLYVASDWNNNVLRFNGSTGAFIDEFVTDGSGGLSSAIGLAFGPDGDLYVSSWVEDEVLRFQGPNGASPGAFIDVYVSGSGLREAVYIEFVPSEQVTILDPTPTIDLDANDSSGSTGADFDTSFTEDAGAVLIADIDATLGNVTNLTALYVTITNQLDGALETLTANTTGTSVIASYDSGTGVLSLTGLDTVANYQQVLRTITYNNSSQSPNTTDRSITFVAWLNSSDSSAATTTVTINAVNDDATVSSDSQVLIETNAPLSTSGTLTSSDIDNPDNTFTPANIVGTIGTFDIDTAGAWTFLANSAFDNLGVGDNVNETFNVTSVDGTASTVQIQINGTNDDPVITVGAGDSAAETLTETDSGLTVADTLTLTDVDTTNTVSSTVATVVESGDVSGIANVTLLAMMGVTGDLTNVETTDTLDWTFNSGAEAFDYLAAGESLVLTYTIEVTDSNSATDTQTVVITINGTNDDPVITIGAGSAAETLIETDAGLTVADTLTLTDIDTTNTVTSAVATVVESGDVSGIANVTLLAMMGVAGDLTNVETTDTLDWTFNSGAEAFDYLAAGESLVLTYTIEVTDSSSATDTHTVVITITGTNDAPVAVADTAATTENAVITIDVLANDTDLDTSDTHTVSAVNTTGTNGTVLITNAGADVSYDPGSAYDYLAAGETATDTFSYTILDNNGGTDTATVTVTITGTNDAPVAVADTAATTENAVITIDVLANDTDLDTSDTHTVSAVNTTGTNGTVLITNAGADVSYDPGSAYDYLAAGETATDTFSYTILDNNGGTDTATVTITITGTNDNPVATANTNTIAEDAVAAVTGNMLTDDDGFGLDSDTDSSDILTVTGIDATGADQYGTFVLTAADGSYSYTIDNANAAVQALAVGESLTEVYTYTVDDGHGGTDTATVTITITGTNDNPVATANTNTIAEDAVAAVTGNMLTDDDGFGLDSDTDSSDILTVTGIDATGADQYGTFVLTAADGSYSYTIDNANAAVQALAVGESLTEVYTYTVDDGHGGTDTATVTITITGTNDNPVATANTNTIAEDAVAAVTGNMLTDDDGFGLDSDTDSSDILTVTGIDATGADQYGTFVLTAADGSYSYTIDNANAAVQALAVGESLTEVYTYTVDDGHGGTDTATVTITITGTNDNPVATANTNTIAEDAVAAVTGNMLTDDDGFGLDSDTDSSDILTVTGIDATGADQYGTFVLTAADGSYSYTIDNANAAVQALAVGESLTEVYTYTVDDGHGGTDTATVTITITGTNDNPVATANTNTIAEDAVAAVTGNMLTDDDGFGLDSDTDSSDILTVTGIDATGADQYGTFVLTAADGSYSYTIDNANAAVQALAVGESLTEVYTYTVDDGHGGTDTATVTITITGTNDNPVATANTNTIAEDAVAAVTGNMLTDDDGFGLDSDTDSSDILTVTGIDATGADQYGTFVLTAADGSYSYTIDNANAAVQALAVGESLTEVYTYTVDDGHGGTDTATVTITITGTNDNPVATANTNTIAEDAVAAVTGNMLTDDDGFGLDSDTDSSDILTVTGIDATGADQYGTFVLTAADGSYSYTIDNANAAVQALAVGESLTEVYTYTVDDGHGGTDTATVTITITGTNDNPVATANTNTIAEDAVAAVTGNMLTDDDGFGLDSDTDSSDILTVTGIDATGADQYGTFVLTAADGSYSYTIDNANAAVQALAVGESLTEVYTYTVDDGHGGTDTATVTITITGTNDNPVATANTNTIAEDAVAAVTGNMLTDDDGFGLDSDTDSSDILTVTGIDATGADQYGTFVLTAADGSYSYTIDNANAAVQALAVGESLTEVYTYTVDDGHGGTDTATVTITITGTNDNPVATANTNTIAEDAVAAVTGNMLTDDDGFGLDSDTDSSDILTVTGIDATGADQYGTFVLTAADGSYSYTIDNANAAVQALAVGESLTEVYTYTVDDGHGGTDTATVTITITGTNDNPVLAAIGDQSVNELTQLTFTATATDADLPAENLSFTLDATSVTAGMSIDANSGAFSWTPTEAQDGVHSVTVTVTDDGSGTLSAAETFTITVGEVNVLDDVVSLTTNPEFFEDPETDEGLDPGVEVPTYEEPTENPDIEVKQAPSVAEYLTSQGSADADDQLVHMDDPEMEETEEIIYLTDEIDTDNQSEGREDDRSYIYFDNDLYKNIDPSKYLANNYTAADGLISQSGDNFSILDFDSDDPNQVNVNGDYDLLRQELDESFNTELKSQAVKAKVVTITAASFAVGVVSYLLRAGSMIAGLMSSLPLCRGFDPIAIFSGDKKRKKDRNEIPDTDGHKSETLFDGDAE